MNKSMIKERLAVAVELRKGGLSPSLPDLYKKLAVLDDVEDLIAEVDQLTTKDKSTGEKKPDYIFDCVKAFNHRNYLVRVSQYDCPTCGQLIQEKQPGLWVQTANVEHPLRIREEFDIRMETGKKHSYTLRINVATDNSAKNIRITINEAMFLLQKTKMGLRLSGDYKSQLTLFADIERADD